MTATSHTTVTVPIIGSGDAVDNVAIADGGSDGVTTVKRQVAVLGDPTDIEGLAPVGRGTGVGDPGLAVRSIDSDTDQDVRHILRMILRELRVLTLMLSDSTQEDPDQLRQGLSHQFEQFEGIN
jgi:hypothetical protein